MIEPDAIFGRRTQVRVRTQRKRMLIATEVEARELDEVASFLWRQLDGRRSIAEVTDAVCAQYEVDRDTALADVTEFVRDLIAANFLRLVEEKAPGAGERGALGEPGSAVW